MEKIQAVSQIFNRPNNFGYEIGTVRGSFKGMYEIALTEDCCIKMTSFSIDHENEDVNLSVARVVRSGGKADQSGR